VIPVDEIEGDVDFDEAAEDDAYDLGFDEFTGTKGYNIEGAEVHEGGVKPPADFKMPSNMFTDAGFGSAGTIGGLVTGDFGGFDSFGVGNDFA